MKLRNKKTGKVIEWFNNTDGILPNSLAKLNEEWEDYEEPKVSNSYWYIGYKNEIRTARTHSLSRFADNQITTTRKEIGNYFETREEAEKAVEKLKAWKRLKDKGFRFNTWTIPGEPKAPHIKLVIEAEMDVPDSPYDLDLLFGGEE